MSRPLRIDYADALHHVMNRSRRGTDLFADKADYQQFKDRKFKEHLADIESNILKSQT
ncbi:MAG: hypothetical protein KJP23_20595 [Deltaproteobacteria bacterium]|nr:hypothetical protein [Deltaproteobacteria bacterium]